MTDNQNQYPIPKNKQYPITPSGFTKYKFQELVIDPAISTPLK